MSTSHLTRPRAAVRPPAPAAPTPRPDRRHAAAPREKLNVRFLACLVAVGVVVGAAWYGVHWWQVRYHAAALLVQAGAAESQDRLDRSARYLGLYVGMVPDDVDARARYGRLLDRMAGNNPKAGAGAMAVYEQVLLRDPDRRDIRRRLASLYLDAGQFDDALQHLNYLQKALPEEAEVEEMLGRCHEGRAQYTQAVKDYQSALKQEPGRVDASLRLARLLRDHMSRPSEADKLLADLVRDNPQSYQVRLARAQFQQEGTPSADALKAARADMDEALRLAPDNTDVLLAAAGLAEKRPDGRDEARGRLQKVLDGDPQDPRGYEALASLELHAGRPDEAMAVLRRGLERRPDDPDLLWNLANLVTLLGTPDEGEQLIARLAKTDAAGPRLDYLRAAVRCRRGEWSGACHDLEAVRPLLADSPQITAQCDLLLARCHDAVGDLDAEVLVCRRAISLDPSQSGVGLMLAAALSKLGRDTEALAECQRLADLPQAPAEGRLLMARLLILQNLRLSADHQQWDRVKQILDEAGDAPEVPLLRAEMLVAQKAVGDARAVLEAAKDKDPRRGELWFALAYLAAREGKPEDGLRLLDDAGRQLGDSAGLRLARLRCLSASGKGDEKRFASIEEGLDRLPEDDRAKVINALAQVHAGQGRSGEARRLWTEAARLRPNDLDLRLRLFDLALQDKDDSLMKDGLEAIRRLEGEGGPYGQYDEARRLIALAVQGDKGGLPQARAELMDVGKRRPGWSRVPLCLGQIDELEGHEARALENYMRAIELGERQFDVLRRTVQLLYTHKRYTDAELVMQRLPEQAPVLGDLQRVAAEISLQTGDYNRALELADKAVADNSTDYHDYLWLGQMLWASSQRADISAEQRRVVGIRAEKALWQGARMGGKAPDGWVVLVQYLARVGATDRADDAIKEAEGKLPADDAPLALAQCYRYLNRVDRAKELFQSALRARPDDVAVLRTAADFYLYVNDEAEAEACLRKIIGLGAKYPEAATWARSVLAVVLAASGDYQRSREAMKLVGLSGEKADKVPPPSDNVEQERSMAAVLALKPGRREHLQAIEILERLAGRQALSSEDRFLLVQLYEQVGKPQRAWDLMVPLLQAGDNPRYLAHAVDVLLDQNRPDEAEPWLSDLEKLQRQSPSLRTVFLRARLLKSRGKGPDGAALLKKQAAGKDAATALRLAVLIEALGYAEDAADLYERYAQEAKDPEAVLVLAQYLGRQKQTAQALDLCEGAWEKCRPVAVAEASLAVLSAAPGNEAQFQRLEKRLGAALEKQPDRLEFVLCQASLQEIRGRYDAAEALYRKVLARDERNAVAANNLAWILALHDGKGDEALGYIGRAMDVLGPIPELLDTRAVVYLTAGQPDVALADLREALDRPGLDAKVRSSLHYHLIQAQVRTGERREDVEKTWREATAKGLGADVLNPLERAEYEKLAAEFGRP